MRKVLVLAFALTVAFAAPGWASSVTAACPASWTFGGTLRSLHWGDVWVDEESQAGDQDNAKEWPGGALHHWDMTKRSGRPLFLFCLYGKSWGHHLAVSIPEGVSSCEVEWLGAKWNAKEKLNADYVRVVRAECKGKVQGQPSQVYPIEQQTVSTKIEGLRLRQSQEALKRVVLARKGTWFQAASGAPAEVTMGGKKLQVIFSQATGLSREIVVHGPPLVPGDGKPFYAAIIRRFGFPADPYLKCGAAWDPKPEVQVEWRHDCGTHPQPAAQEMRLIDMADPESLKQRGK